MHTYFIMENQYINISQCLEFIKDYYVDLQHVSQTF